MARVAGFGFSTTQGRDLKGLAEDLARIKGLGAGFAELSLFASDVIADGRPIPSRVAALRQICGDSGLRFTVHGPLAANFMDAVHAPMFAEVVAAFIDVSAEVGATALVLHTGIVEGAPQSQLDALHALEREHLHRLGDHAAKAGLKLAVETLFSFDPKLYTATPSRLAQEIAAIDHPAVVGTLDVSHAYLNSAMNGLDAEAEVLAFGPVTGHVHLHDSFGKAQTVRGFTASENAAFGQGDLHLPLGWGSIPFANLLPRLALRPETVLTIELPIFYADAAGDCADQVRSWLPAIEAA